jgi:hypothetical protein
MNPGAILPHLIGQQLDGKLANVNTSTFERNP